MNANYQLREYQCTDNYYRYGTILLTDGALAFAKLFEAFWFWTLSQVISATCRTKSFRYGNL